MTEDQVTQTLDYARTLWPKWRPDQADVDAWERLLARFNTPDVARHALRDLKDANSYNSPNRKEFHDAIAKQTGQARGGSALHNGHPGMYVQCISHHKPSHIGEFRTIYWHTDQPMPPEPAILHRLEQFRQEQAALYGGEWQLIRSMYAGPLDDGDMMRRRAELRQPATPTRGPITQSVRDFLGTAKPPILSDDEPF